MGRLALALSLLALAGCHISASTPAARLTHVTCAYGGSGPAPIDYVTIVLMLDLAAVREIKRLEVSAIDVVDSSGAVVAHARPPISLRVAPPGRSNLDYSDFGTLPLSKPISAGVTVRLRAAADLTPFQNAYAATLRYRASLKTDDGSLLSLEGPLDAPWPTAGPAGSR